MLTRMLPRNKLLRAYLLGLFTGMGAACAYVAGLHWRKRREEKRLQDAFARNYWQEWEASEAKKSKETTDA